MLEIHPASLPSHLAATVSLLLAGFFSTATSPAQETTSPRIGPSRGSLLLAGGGDLEEVVLQRFLELAGGPEALVVVIPTAGGAPDYGPGWPGLAELRRAGARRLALLHTYDRQVADSESFVEPLREAGGVWFSGGRQWRLVDAYMHTRTHRELEALLERGGVVGGTSAGATIQGSYLARGDTKTNTIMMGDHEEGLGLLADVAVDQHLLRRNRHFDLLEIVEARPELLGIGLDEGAAIVVHRDRFEVMGGYVAIYDARRRLDSGGRFYFLAPGDRYDLARRQPLRRQTRYEPLERVVEEEWSGSKSPD